MIKHQLQVNLHLLIEVIQVIILKRLQITIKTEEIQCKQIIKININVKKIMEKQSISMPKIDNIVSNGRLLDKRLPDNTVADIGNIKPKTRKSKSSNKTKKPVQKTDRVRKSKTNKISSKSRIKKQVSPKNVSINLLNPTKKVDVYVNPDLYLKINSLFYPHLFVKSSHNFKFFSNLDLFLRQIFGISYFSRTYDKKI